MKTSLKAGISLLLATAAFGWHQNRGSYSSTGDAPQRTLETGNPAPAPIASSVPLRLPGKKPTPIVRSSATASLPSQCPKENYHEIMAYYQKNSWNACTDMKTSVLMTNGTDRYYRAEIERLSSPLQGENAEHRFRVSITQVPTKDSDRGTPVFSETISTSLQNIYAGNLREFMPPDQGEPFGEAWQDRGDVDSLCYNAQTREYARMLSGTLTHPRGRFLTRAEINIKGGKRMRVLCQDVNNCHCSVKRITMKPDR